VTMIDKVKRVVIEWLDDKYHFGDAESLIKSDDMSLLDGGVLDSLGFVNLTLYLEEFYKLKIDRKSLTRDNFDSLKKIATYVTTHPQFKAG
jgi:acyl carrier protein